jgi:hypothetical protein
MDKVEEMWAALAAYQPQAVAAGHGPSWARMCEEKTADAAADAADAANAAADAAADAANAANAAYYAAADAAADAADAKKWAQIAIGRITRVLVKPAPEQYTALEQALTRLQKRYGELEAKVAAQRQWVGLPDDDVYLLAHPRLARAIEAKLKEKNT